MKKSVLLVEPDAEVCRQVTQALSDVLELTCVDTSKSALKALSARSFSLLLLDVKLPDGSGIEFCKNMREQEEYYDLPIFFLTRQSEITDKVRSFEAGADDYILKPVDPAELRARVLGQIRRRSNTYSQIRVDNYRVDFTQHKIFEIDQDNTESALSLTPLEFKIFSHFLKSPSKIFTRSELLRLFWGNNVYLSKNTVDTHISSLRKKLGAGSTAIKSVFKQGYCYSPRKNVSKKMPFAENSSGNNSYMP
jgi:two-component system phosphate regulon response regulator PhoB